MGHRAAVNVVDFDEKYIVSASGDRTIKVIEVPLLWRQNLFCAKGQSSLSKTSGSLPFHLASYKFYGIASEHSGKGKGRLGQCQLPYGLDFRSLSQLLASHSLNLIRKERP